MSSVDIPKSFGALLLGGLFASLLSGLVIIQSVIYYKVYPRDSNRLKFLVLAVLVLDICHTGFIWAALWSYLVVNYGLASGIDIIHWNVALTIVMTAILTLLVHLFFANRIYLLSKKNLWLTIPLVLFAVLRLVSACVTTAEMLHLGTYSKFKEEIRWIFTTGLALSSVIDVLITSSLFALLHASRADSESPGLNAVIDALIRYAFETGSLTCAGTVISMICWLAMPNNLIFMGLHFVISKLYANSLLVTLNSRDKVRRARSQSSKELGGMPVHLLNTRRQRFGTDTSSRHSESPTDSKGQIITQLEVNVERTVIYEAGI
ncbi:hypothetical protein BDN70DRAFT_674275 [Pholiota conissans]|uniref:DUF6534 domain-containing protein n=1 Tax=Pholiota conissans TaxID=109636 RepID=A0A9P5Z566_9AGAR|nr:hypothetical protein BDN70DRAFT_674275 [Pholiota conissans]